MTASSPEDSGTAAPDPRIEAVAKVISQYERPDAIDREDACKVLIAVDAADRAAGVIRVRVDDATEAVHIAICESSIEDCLAYRGRCVKAVEALVTP